VISSSISPFLSILCDEFEFLSLYDAEERLGKSSLGCCQGDWGEAARHLCDGIHPPDSGLQAMEKLHR
jgi:hypothetical protein